MATKGEKRNQSEEFAVAAWDWAGELVRDANLLTQVSMAPTSRRGVWSVSVRAIVHVDGKGWRVASQLGAEWPNSEHVELWAFITRLQMRLAEQVVEDAKGGWLTV